MKIRSLHGFFAASFIIFCIGTSLFTLNIPTLPSKNYTSDQDLHNNLDTMLPVGPAGNPGEGIDYKSNAGTNLILQTIIDSVLGVVLTSVQNVNQSTKIPLSFGPIEFEFGAKISWIDIPELAQKTLW